MNLRNIGIKDEIKIFHLRVNCNELVTHAGFSSVKSHTCLLMLLLSVVFGLYVHQASFLSIRITVRLKFEPKFTVKVIWKIS